MEKNDKSKQQRLAGYDPAQYHRMTAMFVVLSLINVGFVILAFLRTGYGLYHAEEALSHVSKVTQCVHSVNESAQNIVIHCDDKELLDEELATIDELFATIDEESAKYRSIDLTRIGKDLKSDFDNASLTATYYQHALKDFTEELQAQGTPNSDETAQIYSNLIEPLKVNAENSMNELFDKQSTATTAFFFKSAQQFLFVLLFLFVTLTVGVIGISRMRKNARTSAESAQLEREKAERMREKTVDIAYSSILTGFKNYYGLEKDLRDRVGSEDLVIALCRFNRFSQINEIYGRERADEFVAQVSKELGNEFGSKATLYSTGTDEFCFLFHKALDSVRMEELVKKIADTLSKSFTVGNAMIQQPVSCCYYHCSHDAQDSFAQLFCTLDRAMSVAKEQFTMNGQNAIVNVNALS